MAITNTVLNQSSAAQTTNGSSGDLGVGFYDLLAVDLNISAASGTTPTLNIYVDRKGVDGNYYNVWAAGQVSGSGTISTTIGAGAATDQDFGETARLRWVVGGTTPSFTFSASITGKTM